jgi:hypothetical protein
LRIDSEPGKNTPTPMRSSMPSPTTGFRSPSMASCPHSPSATPSDDL